jgi:hypothetical protein
MGFVWSFSPPNLKDYCTGKIRNCQAEKDSSEKHEREKDATKERVARGTALRATKMS